ncbi:YvrJ family protein [Bacillus sp. APMAM]|nr:YvrJ family protein [Bacillus sp. APMAM]RTZ55915.1 YvrJ family protein [Bacillus sp. SAJ1]
MSADELKIYFSLIGNFGFPVGLTIYLLLRFEKKIERLTEAIERLRN